MKTNFFLLVAIIAVVSISFSSCKKDLPDPVLGVPATHQWDGATLAVIDSISSSQPEQARYLIQSSNLGQRILDYLGIKSGAKVEYFVIKASSKDTVKVLDKADNVLDGFLTKDQLLVRITPKGGKAKMYFVRCMNGMVSAIDGSSTFLGEEIYVLAIGEGPMHHGATYSQVWDMAGRSGLNLTAYRIYKGHKYRVRNARTLQDFKELSSKYGLVRINTLQPGDRLRKNFDSSWDYLR